MRVRPTRLRPARRRAGAAILATAVLSGGLVAATTSTSGAAPVNTTIATSCGARDGDQATIDALDLASKLIGSNRLAVGLNISAGDIPETAGLDQTIDASFAWSATLDQSLIDQAAALIPSIQVRNLSGNMIVRGPSSVGSFAGTAPDVDLSPQPGQPANIPLGVYGGPITTTGGGIITYRVGDLQFDATMNVPSAGLSLNLKLACSVTGSNLIAKTTVKDPDAPTFTPEVVSLEAPAGGSASVDLLGTVIQPGKTPLLPETLKIVEPPAGGTAAIANGVFTYTAPDAPGTYSTTVEVCGAPKDESGTPGINERQLLALGANWPDVGRGGGLPLVGDALLPRPIAFSLKVGDEETRLIWTARHALAPFGSFPIPGLEPTPENWAPADSAGIVGDYATVAVYDGVSPAAVQAAIEALPSIGAGNVVVTAVNGDEARPNVVTGLQIEFVNDKAEQDIATLEVGQWYAAPPQEALDRINEVIAGLTASLSPDPDAPPGPFEGMTPEQIDKAIGDKLLGSFVGGPPVTSEEWSAWVMSKLNLGELVPALTKFIDGLFPRKIEPSTIEQGEAGTPPQQLCAQGIIDVTVTEVASATTVPPGGAQVGGISDSRGGSGIGFVG